MKCAEFCAKCCNPQEMEVKGGAPQSMVSKRGEHLQRDPQVTTDSTLF